jgi:hypothetical protein
MAAKKPFKGTIKLDVRDSTPDWEPYTPTKAPAGSPNILFVLYDDTGTTQRGESAAREGTVRSTRAH